MYCLVLCKLDKTYLLRHIIYNVSTDSNISELKKKYYEEYNKIDTDEFYLCADKNEVNELFVKKHITTFFYQRLPTYEVVSFWHVMVKRDKAEKQIENQLMDLLHLYMQGRRDCN